LLPKTPKPHIIIKNAREAQLRAQSLQATGAIERPPQTLPPFLKQLPKKWSHSCLPLFGPTAPVFLGCCAIKPIG